MKYSHLYLALDLLDEEIRENNIVDFAGYADRLEQRIMLTSIKDRLPGQVRTDIQTVYQLLRRGYSWQELADYIEAH